MDDPCTDYYPSACRHCVVQHHQAIVGLLCPGEFDAAYAATPLVVLTSPYRSVVTPLLSYLEKADQRDPERGLAVVILPEIVPGRWWQHLLHNQTTFQLKAVLLFRQERGGEARIVINVPYHLCGRRLVPQTCYNDTAGSVTSKNGGASVCGGKA